jgi:hypothetical protein
VLERDGLEFHPDLVRVDVKGVGPGEVGRMPLDIRIEGGHREWTTLRSRLRHRGADIRLVRVVEGVLREVHHILVGLVTVDMGVARVVHGMGWVVVAVGGHGAVTGRVGFDGWG